MNDSSGRYSSQSGPNVPRWFLHPAYGFKTDTGSLPTVFKIEDKHGEENKREAKG